MAKKYLDDNGVRYLWTKLKNWVNSAVPSKTEVASNTEARHTHGNKNVIDGITANNISSWDGKVENYIVTVTEHGDEENGYTYTGNNWQGIEAAYNANKRVYCNALGLLLPLQLLVSGVNASFYMTLPVDNKNFSVMSISISLSDGATTVEQYYYSLPEKVSDLTNDSGFVTSTDGLKIVKSSTAPTNADSNTITFVV